MAEIPDSPLSAHDVGVIREAIASAARDEFSLRRGVEIVVSSERVKVAPLRLFGLPVRRSDALGLNEGLLIRQGREPVSFDFEEEP